MRSRLLLPVVSALSLLLAAPVQGTALELRASPVSGPAGVAPPSVSADPVVTGLRLPTDVASPAGSPDLFITQKCGGIRVWAGGQLRRVGTLASRVDCDGERGLLSLVFHPDFATNHRAFVLYTRKDSGDVQLARIRIMSKQLVAGSFKPILRIRHRQASNHNGGDLAFDHRGLLYLSVGDGGGGGNQFGHAQDRQSLLGKILRIDVDHGSPYSIPKTNPLVGKPGRGEIWAIGMRNPWRMAYDPNTRAMWVGDVGQDAVEEVDRVSVTITRLLNGGWSRFEGDRVYDSGERLRGGKRMVPVHTYDHPAGESIIGGAVYRGSLSPALQGYYVYGDINGWIAGFDTTDSTQTFQIDPGGTLFTISQAGDGELYAGYADGTLYHLVVPSA
jgi:glucose/arabinose dehydrogenase